MDRFDRKLAAYRKAHRMTVPDPLSVRCETRDCGKCGGTALNVLTGTVSPCTCSCHKPAKKR